MKSLSRVSDNLIGQPMFKLLAKTKAMEKQGKRIFHFEIGDTNFDTASEAILAAKRALDEGRTHYTNSLGIDEFRQAAVNYTEKFWGFKPSLSQVVICPANAVVDFVVRLVSNPGDEIIIPDPCFPTYSSAIIYNGMVPVRVPLLEENDFNIRPEDIEKRITQKTRLIILNSPSNPTGAIMREKDARAIAEIVKKNDVYVLTDEVYARIIYEGAHHSVSFHDHCKERTILLNSLSKTYGMSGWRLGYAVGPELLIEKMGLLLQTIMSCLPAFTQLGGEAVLNGGESFIKEKVSELRARRDFVVERINNIKGLSCKKNDGAFYILINVKETGLTSADYAGLVLDQTGVCFLPGDCFGHYGEGFVRLCYASSPKEELGEALLRVENFHNDYFK